MTLSCRVRTVFRLLSVLLLLVTGLAFGQDRVVEWKKIDPPNDWKESPDSWIRTSRAEFEQFQKALTSGTLQEPSQAPVILNATYRARFDGQQLLSGKLSWQLHHLDTRPGFVTLGRSSLSVSQLQVGKREAIHGINPQGDWQLWCEQGAQQITGEWAQWGSTRLSSRVFDFQLPRSLSSRLELDLPQEWDAKIAGVSAEVQASEQAGIRRWVFDLGRQVRISLKIEPSRKAEVPRILIRENSLYGLTTTDDLIRLRSEWECVVLNSRQTELRLAVPKPLRVFHVMLSGEIAIPFERELGSESDQIRIPLRALTPGQKVNLQILAEVRRSSNKSILLPRLLPLNAVIQEGMAVLAVDRPLEIRSVETDGARPVLQTEDAGKELRRYELTKPDCRISVNVGEPVPVVTGDVRFLADLRGEVHRARARVRMSVREGELFTPQLSLPAEWDPISVTLVDSLDGSPAAMATSRNGAGDVIVGLELRQPIRSDRDCTILLDMKSIPGNSQPAAKRIPAPRVVSAQECTLQGVLWDHAPWEVQENSPLPVETTNDAPDAEFLLSMNWGDPPPDPVVATSVRIGDWKEGPEPRFRKSDLSVADSESPRVEQESLNLSSILSAHVEVTTQTTRVASAHTHRATFRFNRPVAPGEVVLELSPAASPIRMTTGAREITFVRQDSRLILDPTGQSVDRLDLEYQTEAKSGWIVARDSMFFPRTNCLITEFVWHVDLDPQRRLYKMPLTAASTPREQPPIWQRLLGPLSRTGSESVFNPLRSADLRSLMNGTPADAADTQRESLWFIAPQIPEDLTFKTWNLATATSLAWSCLLLCLCLGIGLRRARSGWFSRWWIYMGGMFLVLSVFVGEPYAPIVGGCFLGVVLAILIPRKFALGTGWNSSKSRESSATFRTAVTSLMIGLSICAGALGRQESGIASFEYFEISDADDPSTAIAFSSRIRAEWDEWQRKATHPDWLLAKADYQLEDAPGAPVFTGTFQLTQFSENSLPLRISLEGVTLEQVEGVLDGDPVRLIPSRDERGFIVPLASAIRPDDSDPPNNILEARENRPRSRQVVVRFRPLRSPQVEIPEFTGSFPPLPESRVTLSDNWNIDFGEYSNRLVASRTMVIGPSPEFRLSSSPATENVPDNLIDVALRTLVECGPLGARVQTGIQPHLSDPTRVAQLSIRLPAQHWIQSITGPSVMQSEIDDSDPNEVRVRLLLSPVDGKTTDPVEIVSFLPPGKTGYALRSARWDPSPKRALPKTAQPNHSLVGLVARPGYTVRSDKFSGQARSISSQEFSDSLFSGIVWQVPDFAWSLTENDTVRWEILPIESQTRGQFRQTLTVDQLRSRWQLDGRIDMTQGIPFEHRFHVDPRLEIQRASVTQDGAERLFRWTQEFDPATQRKVLSLSIRDGQPGTQVILIEGQWKTESGHWTPPVAEFASGVTVDDQISLKHAPRVVSEIQGEAGITLADEKRELEFRLGDPNAPRSIQLKPVQEAREARAWIDLQPRDDHSWQVTIRTQLKEKLPASQPIRITWESVGLSDLRSTNRREQVRQLPDQTGFQWRPQSTVTRPAEMTLTALWRPEPGVPLAWPRLTGIQWSEAWVTLPKGVGYRPVRRIATLVPELPASWPAHWKQDYAQSRLELYESHRDPLQLEEESQDTTPRPVWAESLVWMGQKSGTSDVASSCLGTTTYLLVSERAMALKIPGTLQSHVRGVIVNGIMQSADLPVRIPARINDISHEVVVFWESPSPVVPGTGNWFDFSNSVKWPHRWAVVPPYQQVALSGQPERSKFLTEYWLVRAESMLTAVEEFRGASWKVDGSLIQHLAECRSELASRQNRSPDEISRRDAIEREWREFTRDGSRIIAPVAHMNDDPEIGLDATLALCGESRSLWIPPDDPTASSTPKMLDRRWVLGLMATLAAILSLGVLMWFVRMFRRLDIPERLAARPNATLIGMGIIWWLGLSPSVFGMVLTWIGISMWLHDRWKARQLAENPGSHVLSGEFQDTGSRT